jgi:hypothetical protein
MAYHMRHSLILSSEKRLLATCQYYDKGGNLD